MSAEVSDTTGDDSSNAVILKKSLIILINLKRHLTLLKHTLL
jgi:hypothetical protein